jgi:hypothetical protein
MNKRFWLSLGIAATFAPASAQAQADATEAASRNWAAIAECAAVDSPEQRHRCVDDVLRHAGLLSEARVAQEARRDFGRDAPARPTRPAPPPRPSASAPASASASASVPESTVATDKLATTIASVRTIGYQRLRVTTAEGSIWDQTEAETFNSSPKVGDTFEIERAALGSYRCRFARSSRYRCERVD